MKELQQMLQNGFNVFFTAIDKHTTHIRVVKVATKSHWTATKNTVDLERSNFLATAESEIALQEIHANSSTKPA